MWSMFEGQHLPVWVPWAVGFADHTVCCSPCPVSCCSSSCSASCCSPCPAACCSLLRLVLLAPPSLPASLPRRVGMCLTWRCPPISSRGSVGCVQFKMRLFRMRRGVLVCTLFAPAREASFPRTQMVDVLTGLRVCLAVQALGVANRKPAAAAMKVCACAAALQVLACAGTPCGAQCDCAAGWHGAP